jgi:hypothetical protein
MVQEVHKKRKGVVREKSYLPPEWEWGTTDFENSARQYLNPKNEF